MAEDVLTWNIQDLLSYSIPNDDPLVKLIGITLVITAGILGSFFVHKIDIMSS